MVDEILAMVGGIWGKCTNIGGIWGIPSGKLT